MAYTSIRNRGLEATDTLLRLCCERNFYLTRTEIEEGIRNGADFNSHPRECNISIACGLIAFGNVDAITASINFAGTYDVAELLKYIFGMPCSSKRDHKLPRDSTTISQILTLLLHRVKTHPAERVNWKERGDVVQALFSSAARYGFLTTIVGILRKEEEYFQKMYDDCESSTPVSLTIEYSMAAGKQKQKEEMKEYCMVAFMDEGYPNCGKSVRLLRVLARKFGIEDISLQVGQGVEVVVKGAQRSPLHFLIATSDIKGVENCLLTEQKVDFSVKDYSGRNPLHCVCSVLLEINTAINICALMLNRLETHPNDRVDWGQKDTEGYDFLTLAAKNQRLCAFFPLCCNHPFFADRVEPFSLTVVYKWDISKLKKTTTDFAASFEKMIGGTEPDCLLETYCSACKPHEWKLENIINSVKSGAYCIPYLIKAIQARNVIAMRAFLQTPHDIDFNVLFSTGNTMPETNLMHLVAYHLLPSEEDDVRQLDVKKVSPGDMVHAVLERFTSRDHLNEYIDWEMKDGSERGNNFLSIVAWQGCLAKVWEVFCEYEIPYFVNKMRRKEKIPLTQYIRVSDLVQLKGDQHLFEFRGEC